MTDRIMYVCSECASGNPEGCGYYDRTNLRVMDDGSWLCDGCFDAVAFSDKKHFESGRCWSDYPEPPEYGPVTPVQREGK
jgi:hypothetical protein